MFNNYTKIIGLIFLITLSACGSKEEKITANTVIPPSPPTGVEGYIVKVIPVGETLELPGTIISNESTEIHPEISGRLTYLKINEGNRVSKGTLLAKIYDGDLRAKLNKLQVQLKVQEETVRRYEQLYKINGVSTQEYDIIKLQTSNLKADMQIINSDIKRTEIRAPFTGTLGLKMVSTGAYVSPQTVITSIQQTDDLKLDFTLPEKFANQLNVGDKVNFTSERNPKTYSATIVARESGVSESDRSLKIRAKITNSDKEILPGNFVKINVEFAQDKESIMVPSQSIIPLARGKQIAIAKSGVVKFANVETGLRNEKMVQVTDGISVGDTIIITGLMKLKEGNKIKINKITSE
ncbi:MAG: efflux RND transporter periplasmic adaptor subunit [Ferruginibacter sp.]